MQMVRRGQEMKTLREQIAKLEADLGLAPPGRRSSSTRSAKRYSVEPVEGRPRMAPWFDKLTTGLGNSRSDTTPTGWKRPARIV